MKRLFTLCSAALALALSLGAAPALAASFVVTTLADSGAGSLRQAITDANANPGADTITFSVSGTIVLTAVLDIRDTLTIDGAGQSVTISGNNAVPVIDTFYAPASTLLTLNSLTIANGNGGIGGLRAGGVFAGNGTSLTVTRCVFSSNSGGSDLAGAIASTNTAGTLTVSNSRFTGNSGSNASAVYSVATTVITNSTFDNNVGPSSALLVNGAAVTTLTASGNTFSGNSATNACCGAILTSVPGTITNSTFVGNSSAGQAGALGAGGGTGQLTVTNSTFSGNVSGLGGALAGSNPSIVLRNTIVANSTGGNCGAGIIDGGGNLSDDATCAFTAATSLNSTLAQLGPLQNNGGPTQTMAPQTGSPAIDQGVNTLATGANGAALTTDQRGSGFPRISPTGGTVDRGAFEVTAVPPPPPPPTLVLSTCPSATAQVGTAYSSGLVATGGTPPNTFSISAGSLPGGLTINATSGVISGTPTAAGTFAFTAQVMDAATPTAQSSTKACSITVTGVVVVGGQLAVSPTALAFGSVPRLSLRYKTVTLTNTGSTGVTLGKVSVTPASGTGKWVFTSLSGCGSTLAAGKSCSVAVVLATDKLGTQAANLKIPNSATGSPQAVVLSATVVPR
jgi:Putative Ig domain